MCEGNHKGCPYGWAPFVLRTQGMHEIHRSNPTSTKLSSPITTPPQQICQKPLQPSPLPLGGRGLG